MQNKKLKVIKEKIKQFIDERDWNQYQTPKNLSMSVAIEAAELMEHFQWVRNKEEAEQHIKSNKVKIGEEIADVAIYLLELCEVLDINLLEAIEDKIIKNGKKYPPNK